MWIWQEMTRSSWTEKQTNLEALSHIKEDRELLQGMELRKIIYVSHIVSHNDFIMNILERKDRVVDLGLLLKMLK